MLYSSPAIWTPQGRLEDFRAAFQIWYCGKLRPPAYFWRRSPTATLVLHDMYRACRCHPTPCLIHAIKWKLPCWCQKLIWGGQEAYYSIRSTIGSLPIFKFTQKRRIPTICARHPSPRCSVLNSSHFVSPTALFCFVLTVRKLSCFTMLLTKRPFILAPL